MLCRHPSKRSIRQSAALVSRARYQLNRNGHQGICARSASSAGCLSEDIPRPLTFWRNSRVVNARFTR